ncbi:MAG: response regulator transcription factor [Staphylococcus sp.]|nr:response regulator transcription factor [Staphylococcus sp.]
MTTLLIVDDHPIVLEGIKSVLARKGFKVLKASSPEEALMCAEHIGTIDLYVIDLSLNDGMDGLNLIEQLRSRGLGKPTVIYTMHEELWNISAIIKANVEGIVLKGDNTAELLLAIQTVAAGGTYRSNTFNERRQEVLKASGILSAKDIEVLRRLSSGESNREIATALGITEKSIEYHRSNILRKLSTKTMLEATRRAIALGIIYTLALLVSIPQALASEPQPVDMGLSVIWADRNLMASTPGEAGDFYAFGETTAKEVYNWETYVHCDGDMFLCHDLGTENLIGTPYDAAARILGDGWRMPTSAEFSELLDSTELRVETIGTMNCVVLASDNGTALTFPLAGYMSEGNIVYEGFYSTLYVADFAFETEDLSSIGIPVCNLISPTYAALLPESAMLLTGSAHLGMNIRPVRDRATTSVSTPTATSPTTVTAIHTLTGAYAGTQTSSLTAGVYIVSYSDGRRAKIAIL